MPLVCIKHSGNTFIRGSNMSVTATWFACLPTRLSTGKTSSCTHNNHNEFIILCCTAILCAFSYPFWYGLSQINIDIIEAYIRIPLHKVT